jgi:hypothetical protein
MQTRAMIFSKAEIAGIGYCTFDFAYICDSDLTIVFVYMKLFLVSQVLPSQAELSIRMHGDPHEHDPRRRLEVSVTHEAAAR